VFIADAKVGNCDCCGERDVVVVELPSLRLGVGCSVKSCRLCLQTALEVADREASELAVKQRGFGW
jgi:hypothetical protein